MYASVAFYSMWKALELVVTAGADAAIQKSTTGIRTKGMWSQTMGSRSGGSNTVIVAASSSRRRIDPGEEYLSSYSASCHSTLKSQCPIVIERLRSRSHLCRH